MNPENNSSTASPKKILEEHIPGSPTRPGDEALRRNLEAAAWLEAREASLEPSPGFLAASRRRLEARIRDQAPRPWWQNTWARPQVRLAVNSTCLAVLLIFLALFNMRLFAASLIALPGETLYPVKQAYESTRLAFTFSEAQQASLHVAFARQRSNELQSLLLEGQLKYLEITSLRLLEQVKQANEALLFAQDIDPAERQLLVQELSSMLSMQNLVLQALRPGMPAESQAVVNFLILSAH